MTENSDVFSDKIKFAAGNQNRFCVPARERPKIFDAGTQNRDCSVPADKVKFVSKKTMASENSGKKSGYRVEFSNREYLGFATYARGKDGQWRLLFNWRRIFILLAVLVVLAYSALTALLYGWFSYRQNLEDVKISQAIVYPFSAETRIALRKEVGDKIIADAKAEFQEKKDFGSYFQKIRAGLIYSPNNPDGRIDFASLLFFQKRTREAFEFLRDGLPYALNHKTYVQFFVRQGLELAQDDVIISAAETLLPQFDAEAQTTPKPNSLADNRLILVIGAAQAHLLRGRFDKAKEILAENHVENTLSGRVLLAQIDWESGKREEALATLRDALKAAPGNEQVSLLYALYLKDSGDVSAARDVLVRLALLKNDPTIRVKIITLFPGEENSAYRRRLERDFFKRYENDSAALLVFAQYATDSKNFDLVKTIYEHAQKNALVDLPKFELLYLESLVLDGKPAEALKILDDLTVEKYAWVKNYQGVLDCLRALAYYSNNQANLGKINLDRVVKNQSVPAARLIVLARRLDAFGLEEEARNVYENAYLLENGNQTVLLELVNYALRHENVAVLLRYLPPLLETRRPPRAVLEQVQNFLGSDRMLFVSKRDSHIIGVSSMLDAALNDQVIPTDDSVLKSWF